MKKHLKKIISCVVALSLLSGCSKDSKSEKHNKDNKDISVHSSNIDYDSNQVNDKNNVITDNLKNSKDSNTGMNSLRVNDDDMSESKRKLIEYMDNDYITLFNYEQLQRYPDVFDNSQIMLNGNVKKVLYADNERYEILVGMYEDNWVECENNVLIKGYHANNYSANTSSGYRVIEGDEIALYGVSNGSQTVEINGQTEYVPIFTANQLIVDNDLYDFIRYDSNYIKELSKYMFPNGIRLRNPIEGEDFNKNGVWDGIHDYNTIYMIGELDNQSNANFNKYEFYQSTGFIRDNRSTKDIIRDLKMSYNMDHYIYSVYDTSMKTLTIDYYDIGFNKIWAREFENVYIPNFDTLKDNQFFDYTDKYLYLSVNNDFFIIDIETGENKIEPVNVGQKINVRKIEDGILLFSDTPTDTIIKVDLDGNIIWKCDLPLDSSSPNSYSETKIQKDIYAVQVSKENIKVFYGFSEVQYNDYFGEESVVNTSTIIYMLDNDGNLLVKTETL